MRPPRSLPSLVAALSACAAPAPQARRAAPAAIPEIAMHDIAVLDSHMTYREAGRGPALVLLHGNPLSSRVWRDVIPHLAPRARCLAPDLIGMGGSGKPDIPYRFADQARYLEAWIEAMGLREVVLVGHDWGGALAMDWAARHPGGVRGLVLLETLLRPLRWSDYPPQGAELFRALRTPGVGERLVLEENAFLGRSLANGVRRALTDADRAAYAAPFPDARSRRPVLQWTRELPIDGEPADVTAVVERYGEWLARSPAVPKLLLAFDAPTVLGSPAVLAWARAHVAALEVATLGPAGHHAPEDLPHEIGAAIAAWLERGPAPAGER